MGRRVVLRGPLPMRLTSLGKETTEAGACARARLRGASKRCDLKADGPVPGPGLDSEWDARDISMEPLMADRLRRKGLVRHDLPGAREGTSPEWYRGSWTEPCWRQAQVEAYCPATGMHLVVLDAIVPHAADEGEEKRDDG